MMQVFPAFGLLEFVLTFLLGGASLSGLPFGLPPGEMDPALGRAVPEGCVVYVDWAARADGKPGAPGIDGFVADPEITAFVDQVEQTFRSEIDENIPRPEERDGANATLDLVLQALRSPGCLFISFPTADLPPREDSPNFAPLFERLKVALIVNAGDAGDDVEDDLAALFAMGRMEMPPGLSRFSLPIPVPGGGVTLHRERGYFIVCYGQETLDVILEGLAGQSQGLLADERIAAALKQVALERTGQRTWLDVRGLVAAADHVAGGQAQIAETLAPLGLDVIDYLAATTGVDARTGQIVSRIHIAAAAERRGLMSIYTGRPLTPADFTHIPADADLVVAESADHARILAAVREILQAANPERLADFNAAIEQAEAVLGVAIEKELLAGFGGVWTVYDAPSNGGVLATSPLLCLEVQDYDKASRVFLKLMKKLEESLPGPQGGGFRRRGVSLASHAFNVGDAGYTVAFINTVGEEVPVAPAFCLTKTHVLAALHPQAIKAHLRFIHGDAAEKPLDFAADHPLRTRKLVYYRRVDTAAAMRYLTAATPYLGQVLASQLQSEQIDIDLFALPSPRALLPYLSDSTGWVEVEPTGITMEGAVGVPIPGTGSVPLLPMMLIGIRGPVMLR